MESMACSLPTMSVRPCIRAATCPFGTEMDHDKEDLIHKPDGGA